MVLVDMCVCYKGRDGISTLNDVQLWLLLISVG